MILPKHNYTTARTHIYTLEQQLGMRISGPDSVETRAEELFVIVCRAIGRHRVGNHIPRHDVIARMHLWVGAWVCGLRVCTY